MFSPNVYHSSAVDVTLRRCYKEYLSQIAIVLVLSRKTQVPLYNYWKSSFINYILYLTKTVL